LTTLVSLGCDCHPAWWLRKLGLRTQSLPFDWLLSKPHLGLDYAVSVFENGFADCYEDLSTNARGHPVSAHYPRTELFHHHDLVAADATVRAAEKAKLVQRARQFRDLLSHTQVDFLYCYPLTGHKPPADQLAAFSASIDRALATWTPSTLHVYFLADQQGLLGESFLERRPRLVEHAYFRDQTVDKNWGTEPAFLRTLGMPSTTPL